MDMETQIPQQPVYQQPAPPVQPQPSYQQPVYYQPVQPQPVYHQPAPPAQPQPVYYQQPAPPAQPQPVYYQQPAPPVQPQPSYQQPVYYQPVQPQPIYYVPTPPPAQPAPAKKADDRIPDWRFPLISVICLSVSIAYGIYAALVPLFTSGNWTASVTDFLPMILMLLGTCLCRARKDRLFAWGLLSMGIMLSVSNLSDLLSFVNGVQGMGSLPDLLISIGMALSFIAMAVCYFMGTPKGKVLKLCFTATGAAFWLAALLYGVLANLHMPVKYHVDMCLRYVLGMLPIYLAAFFYTPFKK